MYLLAIYLLAIYLLAIYLLAIYRLNMQPPCLALLSLTQKV